VLRSLTADRGDAGRRIDLVIRRHLAGADRATRTRVQKWIAEGLVTLNGVVARRASSRAAFGDVLQVALPEAMGKAVMDAEDLPLDVLYEDDHFIAVDKPPGMVMHPTYGHADHTVINALLWRARTWSASDRPSIVGRLDKLTSGLVVAAKTREAHAALQRATTAPSSRKEYLAIVYGRPGRQGTIDLRLRRDPQDRRRVVASTTAGVTALTKFTRLAQSSVPGVGVAVLRCRLLTGRMHQIRVHLAACGWPIVGDPMYGEPRWRNLNDPLVAAALRTFPRQALHAWRLTIRHPETAVPLMIEAAIPADLRGLLRDVFGLDVSSPALTARD
jgi:23S rRNA pseudouridine1911/1915/1917 synthase